MTHRMQIRLEDAGQMRLELEIKLTTPDVIDTTGEAVEDSKPPSILPPARAERTVVPYLRLVA